MNHYATAMLPARPRKPQDKAQASYCTLYGSLSSDKRRSGGAVAATLPLDEGDIANGFEETAVQIAVTMLVQESAFAPLVDCGRANTELRCQLVGQ